MTVYKLFFFLKQKTAYEMRISDWSFRRVLFRSLDRAARAPASKGMGTWGGASQPSTGSGSAAGKGRRLTAGLACLAREQEQVLDARRRNISVAGKDAFRA